MKKVNDNDFQNIIPTAILTAYPRTLTDIPYADKFFNGLNKNKISEDLIVSKLAPEIEARFKLINKLLTKSKINQVLELASGYSTRGFSLAKNSYDISYVEIDLPEVCNQKINLINSFSEMPDNLHLIPGNALNQNDVNKSEKFFNKKSPVAVINEGLLRYLNFEEKRQVAKNIHRLLSQHGGVWITCDVTPKKFIDNQNKNFSNFNKNLSSLTDRNNSNWRFEDLNHVKGFFDQIGFHIESIHPFSEMKNKLSSPNKLKLGSKQVDNLLKDAIVVVMKIKET